MYTEFERKTLITETAAFTTRVLAAVFAVHETPGKFHGQAVAIGFWVDCLLPLSARDCTAKTMADGLDRRKRAGQFSSWAAEVTAVTALPLGRVLEEPTVLCSRQDESIIVGYYTSAEVPSHSLCPTERSVSHGKK
jgi:hypothetical protein